MHFQLILGYDAVYIGRYVAMSASEEQAVTFDVWLTVHHSLMWNKKPTRCHLVLYLFLLYNLFNMFRATLCPSSGADDLVVFFHVWCSAVTMGSVISIYV